MRASAGSLSRRRFVEFGALACTPGLARAQNVLPPPPGTPPEEAAKIAAASDAAEHLTIPVTINGRGPFRFVVDTGADRSVIADDVAHGARPRAREQRDGARRRAQREHADGRHRRSPFRCDAAPQSHHARSCRGPWLQSDGYLGLDAVDGYRVTLDFKNRELVIEPPHHHTIFDVIRPNEATVPLRGDMGHLRSLNCRVDSVNATCFLDTGAEISVGNSKLLSALMIENPAYVVLATVPITGITGGVITAKVIKVEKIRLHGVTFSECVVADRGHADLRRLGSRGPPRAPDRDEFPA